MSYLISNGVSFVSTVKRRKFFRFEVVKHHLRVTPSQWDLYKGEYKVSRGKLFRVTQVLDFCKLCISRWFRH